MLASIERSDILRIVDIPQLCHNISTNVQSELPAAKVRRDFVVLPRQESYERAAFETTIREL
jgi:hypothetical protein